MGDVGKIEKELIAALKEAVRCVQWMRRRYKHKDEGVPVEALWLGLIDRAEGRPELSTKDFLKRCIALTKSESAP